MRKADNLTTILCRCHVIWDPYLPGTHWAPRACNGTDLPLPMLTHTHTYLGLQSRDFVCCVNAVMNICVAQNVVKLVTGYDPVISPSSILLHARFNIRLPLQM